MLTVGKLMRLVSGGAGDDRWKDLDRRKWNVGFEHGNLGIFGIRFHHLSILVHLDYLLLPPLSMISSLNLIFFWFPGDHHGTVLIFSESDLKKRNDLKQKQVVR